MQQRLKKLIQIMLIILTLFALLIWGMFQLPQFGKAPSGERLTRIQNSPNYKNEQFQNLSATPMMVKGGNQSSVLKRFFFKGAGRKKPAQLLPSAKVDLFALNPKENIIVWFGHSSYFMQLDGKKFLVDPVLSGYASPFPFAIKNFPGSNVYSPSDIPNIDYLFITHDHYDHLDYNTVKALESKVSKVVTGLGVGADLEYWGYAPAKILELDWNEYADLGNGFSVDGISARHFSGRTLKRNQTLWMAFVLSTPSKKMYLGGDGGYDTHFAEVGSKFGPFDLAILENGQYNENWRYIHEMPEETVQAAIDLKAKRLMPVHWGKFILSVHDWDEPIKRVVIEAEKKNLPLLTPMIGSVTNLDNIGTSSPWWEGLK